MFVSKSLFWVLMYTLFLLIMCVGVAILFTTPYFSFHNAVVVLTAFFAVVAGFCLGSI